MMLQFERVVATGTAALDSGIGDTALKTFNGTTYLYSLTGRGGGIVSWRLVDDAAPQIQDQQYYGASITNLVGRSGVPVSLDGEDHLVLDVDTATGLVTYDLASNGTIGNLQETSGLNGGGDIAAAVQLRAGAADFLTLAHSDTDQIGTYRVNPDGTLTATGAVTATADSLKVLQSGSDHYVIAADSVSSAIATYRLDTDTGALSLVEDNDSILTLGVGTPTSVEVVQAYGESWVLIAGSGSSSISVLKLHSDGRLIPADHALDTLYTRFQTVQDMSVVEVDGRVFVVAGGGDDGITLFTMTPDGQLIHMDSFADTLASGLQNVETLVAAHIGDELQIFAASQQDAGLTQLSASVDNLGIIDQGFGTVSGTAQDDILTGGILDSTLIGGAGDDILITGTSDTTMTGGAGADIFVLRQTSGETTITDFQAGVDKLDLSHYAFLRSPAQLEFNATAQGATIEYRGEFIDIRSGTGSLTMGDIFGSGFDWPDHIPVNLNNGPDSNASTGVLGPVTLDASSDNPALQGAEVQFTPDGGATITAQADDDGAFAFEVPDGTFPGELDIYKAYSAETGQITALDALQVLRISVGLDPTFGPASVENLIAADITRDGTINALDALAVLQAAVDQPTAYPAQWVFLDDDADLSGITRTNVDYETGTRVTLIDGDFTTDMTSILLGNIEVV